jgi:hypothetical protein
MRYLPYCKVRDALRAGAGVAETFAKYGIL